MRHFGVLTASPALPVVAELVGAGERLGAAAVVLDLRRLAACAAPASVLHDGRPLDVAPLTAVLPRIGNWRPDSALAVLAALRAAGVPSLNEPAAIRRGRDHWRTSMALAAAGLPHPPTVAGSEPEALAAAAVNLLGFPCVVKKRRSRQGVGVVLCPDRAALDAVLDSLWEVGEEIVVQRFCKPGAVSRRVLVVDREPLGMSEHHARPGEFRANAARGATVTAVPLDPVSAELAVAAATAVGLDLAGVDLLPDDGRWVVGEVNPTPGWQHFAAATGVAVADTVVAALLRRGRRA